MALGINTNPASLTAQRNLNGNSGVLKTSIDRLSSGLRINGSKDDAAGLAISTRFTAQIRGLNQASRNANDAISLSQTADGALGSISDNLQRIRELAVQSANATNSASDRAALNTEASQLVSEIDRVATTTQFNGVNLLDGSFAGQAFQVGANSGQTITVSSLASARSTALGVGSALTYSTSATVAAPSAPAALTAGGVSLNGFAVGATSSDNVSTAGSSYSAIAKAAAINAISGQSGVTATVNATSVTNTATTTSGAYSFVLNGVTISGTNGATAAVNAADITANINSVSAQTGVTASISGASYTLTAADGRNIDINTVTAGGSGATAATTIATLSLSSSSSSGIVVAGTQATAAIFGLAAGATAATSSLTGGVSSLNLATASGASSAITTIDAALSQINSTRATLGALQNRFSSTVSNLATAAGNLTESRSRILDTDYAAETANLSKAQILQQAGTAVLAQANQLPQNVLSLLR